MYQTKATAPGGGQLYETEQLQQEDEPPQSIVWQGTATSSSGRCAGLAAVLSPGARACTRRRSSPRTLSIAFRPAAKVTEGK